MNNTTKIQDCFNSIKRERDYIDIKPYSHNIVGINLRYLSEIANFTDKQMSAVIRLNGLDKLGWSSYLVDDDKKEYNDLKIKYYIYT